MVKDCLHDRVDGQASQLHFCPALRADICGEVSRSTKLGLVGVHDSKFEWTHVEHIEDLVQVSEVFSDRLLDCPAMKIPLDKGELGIFLE